MRKREPYEARTFELQRARGFFRVKIGSLWFGHNVTLLWWLKLPRTFKTRLGLAVFYGTKLK